MPGTYFAGDLSDVRVYNSALSSSQVSQLYGQAAANPAWWKLNEGSGSTAIDADGHYNAQWNGTPAGSSGYFDSGSPSALGYSYSGHFDGATDYINAGNVLNMGTSDWTASAWIRTTNTSNFAGIIGKSLYGAQGGRWYVVMNSGGDNIQAVLDWGSAYAVASAPASLCQDGQWHLVTVTYTRAGNLVLYLDGLAAASADISASAGVNLATNDELLIGAYQDATGQAVMPGTYFAGDLSDVRVYSFALTAAQAGQLYAGTGP
jgi:hypothetical protein